MEMLFNIFEYDFKNEEIITILNQQLSVYDYCYSLNVLDWLLCNFLLE